MTVKEFVQSSLKQKEEFGIAGYNLVKTTALDKPYKAIVLGAPKKTFVDFEVKRKSFVPDAKYEVRTEMEDKKHKSDWAKFDRVLIATDIQNLAKKESRPDPGTYKLGHKYTEKKALGAFNLKGTRD